MKSNELKAMLVQMDTEGIVENADIDWMIVEGANIRRSEIPLGLEIEDEKFSRVVRIMKERLTGKPLAYCLGYQYFYGRKFAVNENTLIPRPETEELVECILKNVKNGRGLDIGTGSGAIAISLNLENKNLKMTAGDVSLGAIEVSKQNAKNLGADVEIIYSNLFEGLKNRKFDFVVSNPPYIKSEDVKNLDNVVKDYEPHLALDGGEDGLDFYRQIIKNSVNYLVDGGMIFFEVGDGEAFLVSKMLENDFTNIQIQKDLENVARIVYATKKRGIK